MDSYFNSGISRSNQSRHYNQQRSREPQRSSIFAPVQSSRYDYINSMSVGDIDNNNSNEQDQVPTQQLTRHTHHRHSAKQPSIYQQPSSRQGQRLRSVNSIYASPEYDATIIEGDQATIQIDTSRYNPNGHLLDDVDSSIRAINRNTTNEVANSNYADYNDTESEYKNNMAASMAQSVVQSAYRNFEMQHANINDAVYSAQGDMISFEVSNGRSVLNRNVANDIVSTYDSYDI